MKEFNRLFPISNAEFPNWVLEVQKLENNKILRGRSLVQKSVTQKDEHNCTKLHIKHYGFY